MVLLMARPWRDPKSGMFYLRTRVPAAFLPKVRGTVAILPVGDEHAQVRISEVAKASLRTRDPATAKARHAVASSALEAHYRAVAAGPVRLNRRQIVAIAGSAYDALGSNLDNEPGTTETWRHVLRLHAEARSKGKLEEWIGPLVDTELSKLHLVVDTESRAALIEEADRAFVQRAETLKRFSEGDFRPDPNATRFPKVKEALALLHADTPTTTEPTAEARNATVGSTAPLSVLEVWQRYEAMPDMASSATLRRWGPSVRAFAAFIDNRPMTSVTAADITLFSDHRLASGISQASVGKVDIAAVKRMFTFAHARGWLTTNPLAGHRRERRRTEEPREREGRVFHPPEYRAILTASKAIYSSPGERGAALLAAIRWVPWICAYSGSRPGEVIQLRKEDFGTEDSIPFFVISPGAGTVKTGRGRRTPVHDCLVEEGLLEFVAKAKSGHLFMNASDTGTDAVRQGIDTVRGRLGEWVRAIGVDDREISPNHAWRHTFKMVARDANIPELIQDAICGQAPATVGRKYGIVTLAAKAEALKLFPRYSLAVSPKAGT